MKINEVLKEGYVSSFVKGVAKGVSNMVAPDAADAVKGAVYKAKAQGQYDPYRSTSAYAQAKSELKFTPQQEKQMDMTVDAAVKQAFAKHNQSMTESIEVPSISVQEINQLMKTAKIPAEGFDYVATRIIEKGVHVPGYQPAPNTMAANLNKYYALPRTAPQGGEDVVQWDPDRSTLIINGFKYLKTKSGWIDHHTKEKIDPKNARELDQAFDKASGRAPVKQPTIGALGRRGAGPAPAPEPEPTPTEPATVVGKVVTPGGVEVVKYSDGSWEIPATDERVVIASDLKKLEELLAQQQEEEPDVFKSNRPAK